MMATKFQPQYHLYLYHLYFRCQARRRDWSKFCRLSVWVRNQRWWWKPEVHMKPRSSAMRDSNTIPTALLMFLRSSNITALARILSYVRVSGISKMVAGNRKWKYTTNFPQNLTWKSIRISPAMMLDVKNWYSRWNFVAINVYKLRLYVVLAVLKVLVDRVHALLFKAERRPATYLSMFV